MNKILKFKYTFLYIVAIPATSFLFLVTPLVHLTDIVWFSPVAFFVGIVYILRDFVQKELGRHTVFIAMGIAAVLTYLFADPALAVASIIAFMFGELSDWVVYTFTTRPLSQRILISNMVALPVDLFVVLIALSYAIPGALPLNIGSFLLMYLANISTAVVIFFVLRHYNK